MNAVFLGIVSLFSLSDYQSADEIYIHPESVVEMNGYSYNHYDIVKDGRQKTCFLDENLRGLCYESCFEDEFQFNNQCVKK